MPTPSMPPLPMELLVPRHQTDQLRAQTARESSRRAPLSSRGASRTPRTPNTAWAPQTPNTNPRVEYRRSKRRPMTTGGFLPVSAPPSTSPYYAPQAPTPRHMTASRAVSTPRTPRTPAGGSESGRKQKMPFVILGERDVLKLFDANLNGRDILFAHVKEDKLKQRDVGRPVTSATPKPSTPGKTQQRSKGAPIPDVWEEKQAGKWKNRPFDETLHKDQLHRSYMKEQLGPSFAGKRKERVVADAIKSYRDLGGSEVRTQLRTGVVSDVLQAVIDESCLYDMTWSNTSDRALWYFPRALLTLRRWPDFAACVCNLHFIVEHSMEFSVPSIVEILTSGCDEQQSDAMNSAAYTREEVQQQQRWRLSVCREYLSFVVQHAASLALHPHTAFQLALEHYGSVQAEAREAMDEFTTLVRMSSRSLPVTDPTVLLALQRATINAQNHGLDLCLSPSDCQALNIMSSEVRDALVRYRLKNPTKDDMQSIADVLVGASGDKGADLNEGKRKQNEGFNDVILACGSDYPTEIQSMVAYAVISFARKPLPSDDSIVDSISRCCEVPRPSLTVTHRYGANAVVRVSEVVASEESDETPGERVLEESALAARNRIMEMAGNASSPLRKERIVTGVGMRGGRWEGISLCLCGGVDDTKGEREYLNKYVLPAIRARCRTRRIDFSWKDLGDSLPNQDGSTRVDLLSKRMSALQLAGITPPGGHRRPFCLSLLTERGGYFPRFDPDDRKGRLICRTAASKRGFEWIGESKYKDRSIPQLEIEAAFMRCSKDSETFFLRRSPEWTQDSKFLNQVPDIVRDSYIEGDPTLQQRVNEFNAQVSKRAASLNRLVTYLPSYHLYERPKNIAESQYAHSHLSVNRDFWREVHERGETVLAALKAVDIEAKGTLTKPKIREALAMVKLDQLISDEELGKLCSAHDQERKGHIEYESLVHSLQGVGTVKLGDLAAFGIKAYACVWAIIDSCFPELAPPGGRPEQEINDQEVVLDILANSHCAGVHAHLQRLLSESVAPSQPLAAIAVGGDSGSGKSTLLASFARRCMNTPSCGAVLYFSMEAWHSVEDMFTCLVAQLDHSVLRHAQTTGTAVGGDALSKALAQHASSSEEDCVIIVDGLRDAQTESILIGVVESHNSEQMRKRCNLVFSTLSIEVKDTRSVLAHSLLPLMPSERVQLIKAHMARRNLHLHHLAIQELASKRGAGNPKYLTTAVAFLARLEASLTEVESFSHLADDLSDLLVFNVIPFLDQTYGSTFRRLLELTHYEPSGITIGSLPSLIKNADSSQAVSLCLDLRELGVFAFTSDVQRLVISCPTVHDACGVWLEDPARTRGGTGEEGMEHPSSPLYGSLLHRRRSYVSNEDLSGSLALMSHLEDDAGAGANEGADSGEEVIMDLENLWLDQIPPDQMTREKAQGVSRLYLSSNKLKFLSKHFGNFASLTSLFAAVNCFSKLPPELPLVTTLTELDLSENQISDLPQGSPLTALERLQVLRLSLNQIANIPDDISILRSLKELHLSSNRLLTLPTSIQALAQLQVLDLSSNRLIEIPDFYSFPDLRRVYLSFNRLTFLPSMVRQAALEDLDIEGNQIGSMPIMAKQHPHLRNLNVAGNKLGYIEGLSGCTGLVSLNASGNRLEEVPPESIYAEGLKSLVMEGNRIKRLSPILFVWTTLKTLDLSNNVIEGIPPEIGALTSMVNLNLSGNQIQTLPNELIDCKKLTRADLEHNPLDLEIAAVAATQNKLGKLCQLNGGLLRPARLSKNHFGPEEGAANETGEDHSQSVHDVVSDRHL